MRVQPWLLTIAFMLVTALPVNAQAVVPTVIVVDTSYPGADANTLAETVAAPIEQQVNGVENLLRMQSRSGPDGQYTLVLNFKPGTNLDQAQVLVQNRVTLALPTLPEEVKRSGITIKKKSPVRMLISLTSPDGMRDLHYLSNYAANQLKDEFVRVAGVSVVTCFGQSDHSLRIWLDPQKLTAFGLTAGEVVKVLRDQNVPIPAGKIGQPPVAKDVSRLQDVKDFEKILLRTDDKGAKVFLRDVATIEMGARNTTSHALHNGQRAVILGIHPTWTTRHSEVSKDINARAAALRKALPKGLKLDVAFDFTPNVEGKASAPEYLLVDVQPADGASQERVHTILERYEKRLRDIVGVQDVLALTENPFELFTHGPCLLVRLTPSDQRKASAEEIGRTVRAKLMDIADANIRVRDLSRPGAFPIGGYPLDFAVSGPDAAKVSDLARRLAEAMQASKKLTDVGIHRESMPSPYVHLNIDREKAARLGVSVADVYDALQVHGGGAYVNDFNRFGRSWQVIVEGDPMSREGDDLKKIKVRNRKGEMVPLEELAAVSEGPAPRAIYRLDQSPMIRINANPVPGAAIGETRQECERLHQQLRMQLRLPADFRLTWISEVK
jgi:multidrug efflux pump subunit AcrB